MSDQQTNDPATADEQSAVPPQAAPVKAKGSSGIAWLALLLVVALGAAAAAVVMEAQRRAAVLDERVQGLETRSGQEDQGLQTLGSRLSGDIQASAKSLDSKLADESSRLTEALSQLEGQLNEQRKELARFSSADRDSWLMAEAQYLLRLANQRLIMAGDTDAAKALLGSADKVLRELDDASLHTVRAAVAADLAAVRAVPKVDVEGIYLRLSALIGQAGALKIFELPELPESAPVEAAEDWQGRLKQGYEAALAKVSDYIIIRRRDVPMQALMDPQWESLVRQNLRMLLEQAQVALLSGNQTLFRESLGRAQHWVNEFAESDTAAANAMDREIKSLQGLTVEVANPDISGSLRALDDAIERRLQQRGES